MNKYFPIKTDTACQLKWTWSSIYLYEGTTNSCHRVTPSALTADTFNTFHNTPKKIADRELMLDGQWPQGGCEYCKKIEDAGGVSDRLFHLNIPNLVPEELDTQVTTMVTPRIVEVYFDNICNMSCIYCSNLYSSKIQQENVKFGRYEQDGLVIDNTHQRHPEFKQLTENFWTWMDANYDSVYRLQVLGGEPFYQAEFDNCMKFLYNRKNSNLEFNVVSNLMIAPDKFKSHIQEIKKLLVGRKIKRFDLTASIDCWGPEQEYIRHGLDLERWRENFEYLVQEKWITLNINQVISALSIPTITELITYINKFRSTRKIGHYLITVNAPSYLNPDIFGPGFFESEFERILAVMPDDDWQQQEIRKYMMGVQSQINNSARNDAELKKLKLYLDEIDRRRNVDWRKTFTWLSEVIDNVV
jgi:pyruvate-formate lyase-activating enzyme